jgi:gas vesicle protein
MALGAASGLALALLTAPKPGRELQADIKEQARNIPDKVSEIVDDSLDLYASSVNYVQLLAEEQSTRLKRAVAAGQLAAAKKREELETGSSALLPYER